MPFTIVLGTRNAKKQQELELLLQSFDVELKSLADFPGAMEVAETGKTFHENAALKATVQAKHLDLWVLGEDSGISVDALGGAPGIYSARFSGDNATDESNNELMLARLEGIPLDQRTARYTCHMTLSDPQGREIINCQGHCCGRILMKAAGDAGFGYDPLFELPEYHRTFGQLGEAVKSVLSHRARATRKFVPELASLIQRGADS